MVRGSWHVVRGWAGVGARLQDSDRMGIVPRGTRVMVARGVSLVAKDAREIAVDSDCRRLPRKRGRQSVIGRGLRCFGQDWGAGGWNYHTETQRRRELEVGMGWIGQDLQDWLAGENFGPRARLIVAREAGSDDNQLSLADLRLLRLNNRRRGR